MANKRMFSLNVVDTDKFLEMPISSRLLYYELGMRADDDGFVDNWKKILMFTGLKDDDMKILISKNFIIPFESGVIVIRHWRMNNYLQNDRTKPTIYQQEFKELDVDENNVYNMYTDRIHSIDKNSIDKNSIDKNSIDIYKSNKTESNTNENDKMLKEEFETIWSEYPRKQGKSKALSKYISVRKKGTTKEEVINGLKNYLTYIKVEKVGQQYIKHGSTWFNNNCWEDDYTITREITTKDLVDNGLVDFSKFREDI